MCEDPCNDSVTGPIVTDTTINVNNIASMINVGGEVEVYKNATVNPFELRTLKKGTEGNTVGDYGLQLVQQAETIDIAYNPLTTNTVWVDQEFGSDITGQIKHEKLKFQTIGAAVAATDDSGIFNIIIAAGFYNETAPLTKNGITLVGSPNVRIASINAFSANVNDFNIIGGLSIEDSSTQPVYLVGGHFDVTNLTISLFFEAPYTNIISCGVFIANSFIIKNYMTDYGVTLNISNSFFNCRLIDFINVFVLNTVSKYNVESFNFLSETATDVEITSLKGMFNEITGNGRFLNACINAYKMYCSTITITDNTSIKVDELIISKSYGSDLQIGYIHYKTLAVSPTVNISFNKLQLIVEGIYLQAFMSTETSIKGVLKIEGNLVETSGTLVETQRQSILQLDGAFVYININNWKNTNNVLQPMLFTFNFTNINNPATIIIKGNYDVFDTFLIINAINKTYISGNFNQKWVNGINNPIFIDNTAALFNCFVYFQNFNLTTNDNRNNFASILCYNFAQTFIDFKYVSIINKGIGANNYCIGSYTGLTLPITISGTFVSNKTLPVAHAAHGTVTNLTSPDLDLITNSNII